MLQNISWQEYFLTIIIATVLYYLFVWLFFFKGKFPRLSSLGNFKSTPLYNDDMPDEMLTTAQHIMDELRSLFEGRTNKNELVYALQNKLKKYNQWDEPGFRETINEFIASQSESICSIRLSEEDQRVLWQA